MHSFSFMVHSLFFKCPQNCLFMVHSAVHAFLFMVHTNRRYGGVAVDVLLETTPRRPGRAFPGKGRRCHWRDASDRCVLRVVHAQGPTFLRWLIVHAPTSPKQPPGAMAKAPAIGIVVLRRPVVSGIVSRRASASCTPPSCGTGHIAMLCRGVSLTTNGCMSK